VTETVRWGALADDAPELAQAGRELLYQYGPGLAFLATLRADGAPRLHPVCPVIVDGGLYVFVVNRSPKVHDLRKDGRYALHTFSAADVDDEFMVAGRAVVVTDTALHDHVLEVYLAQGTTTADDTLFELLIERALHAKYEPRPSGPPVYTRYPSDSRT
jgi:general stress protein 26